jgi:hypothetical protein
MTAWLSTSPALSCRRQSMASLSVSATGGVGGGGGGAGGRGADAQGRRRRPHWPGTRRVRRPVLAFSKARQGPRVRNSSNTAQTKERLVGATGARLNLPRNSSRPSWPRA